MMIVGPGFLLPGLLGFVWLTVTVAAEMTAEEQRISQVEWLRSRGGFFSEKLGFQPPDSDSPAGGIFALQDLKKGEKVIVIPQNCQFEPWPGKEHSKEEHSICSTARRLADGYNAGEGVSEFWPYIKYVFEVFPHEMIPTAWSEEGIELVMNIMGVGGLEPQEFGKGSYAEQCTTNEEDREEILEAALRIVDARGWLATLVPVLDMANHANGYMHNMEQANDSRTHSDIEVVTLRDVKAGEEMSLSYNECNDYTCYGIAHTYTTPFLFADYGFIERMSGTQRWPFATSEDEEDTLLIELSLASDQEASGSSDSEDSPLHLKWLTENPDDEQIEWLQVQLGRLKGIEEWVKYTAAELEEEHEAQVALEFHRSYVTAMEMAIGWADGTPPEQLCSVNQ